MSIDGSSNKAECEYPVKVNGERVAADIRKRLLSLCRTQLERVRMDAENQFEKLTSHGLSASAITEELLLVLKDSDGDPTRAIKYSTNLKGMLESLVMEFQFFDEFSQRIEHIESAIRDFQDDGGWSDSNEEILQRLSRMFSTRSEFNEFKRIFPGADKDLPPSFVGGIELF